jgi:hypothetical protein
MSTSLIDIPDQFYNMILTAVGVPIISLEDLTSGKMSDEDIKNSLIWPAMQLYFRFFPKLNIQEYMVTTTFSFPFPNENTFGVRDARLNTQLIGGGQVYNNPFIDELFIQRTLSRSIGKYGTKNMYDFTESKITEMMERQGAMESSKAFRVRADPTNRVLEGFTNIIGKLKVSWAEWSTDWTDIRFERQLEVVDLARSYVLKFFGDLRQQVSGGMPAELTGADFIERADKLEEKVLESWKQFTKVVIMR